MPLPSGRGSKRRRATARGSRRDQGRGIAEIVDHYEAQIQALDEPRVLIGHSFGGLIVETVPASLSKKRYEKYEGSDAQTDYIEFAGRPHLMMVGEGWEEVAAAINGWLDGVLAFSGVRQGGASA